MNERIYKVVTRQLWAEAEEAGVFRGAPIDLEDGYIHFSTAHQLFERAPSGCGLKLRSRNQSDWDVFRGRGSP